MPDSPLTVRPWSRLYLHCRAMGEIVGGLPVMISIGVWWRNSSPTSMLEHGHGEHVGVGHQRAGRQHCVVTRRGRHFRYIHILFKTAAFNQEKALVGAFSVITNIRMDLFEALVTSLLTLYHPLLPALACLCRHCQPVLGNMLSRIVVCDPGLAIQTAEVTRNAKLP